MKEFTHNLTLAILAAAFCAGAQEKPQPQQRLQPGLLNIRRAVLPAGVQAVRDIEYIPGGGKSRSLDLYRPSQGNLPLPLIVWIHGGAWKMGSKEFGPAIPFTTNGFAVASLNYRLSQEAPFPAQIDDCRAAIRFLRANAAKYNLDGNHIGVWGGSAGGHLVALLGTTGTDSNRVQCVVDWFGPTDLTPDSPGATHKAEAVVQLLGGPIEKKLELAKQASPLRHVTKDAAPFLIMQGDQDPLVNPEHSKLLCAALQKAGVEATLKILPGAGHGGPQFSSAENRQLILEFFERHLKPAPSPRARNGRVLP